MDNTRNTLETPVWGKPTKRGFYYGLSREFTAAENQKFLTEISSASFLTQLKKNNLLFQTFSACFFGPEKSAPPALKKSVVCGLSSASLCCPVWPWFGLHWLPKSGPELALFLSCLPSPSLAQAPSSSSHK
jgi:hypothetical protein